MKIIYCVQVDQLQDCLQNSDYQVRHKRPKKTPVENRYFTALVEILKMKSILFVTVKYIKFYVPNILKKSLILCGIFPSLDPNKNLYDTCYGGHFEIM